MPGTIDELRRDWQAEIERLDKMIAHIEAGNLLDSSVTATQAWVERMRQFRAELEGLLLEYLS